MNLDRWGGWIGLVTNLGVMGGLVLLTIEIRHNSQVMRAQAVTARLTSQIAAVSRRIGFDKSLGAGKSGTSPMRGFCRR